MPESQVTWDGGSEATRARGSNKARNCLGSIPQGQNGWEPLSKVTPDSTIQGNYVGGGVYLWVFLADSQWFLNQQIDSPSDIVHWDDRKSYKVIQEGNFAERFNFSGPVENWCVHPEVPCVFSAFQSQKEDTKLKKIKEKKSRVGKIGSSSQSCWCDQLLWSMICHH